MKAKQGEARLKFSWFNKALFSLAFLFSLFINYNDAQAATGMVVTIDGIDGRSITDPNYVSPEAAYLKNAIYDATTDTGQYWRTLIENKIGPIVPLSWSRNIYDDSTNDIMAWTVLIKKWSDDAKAANKPLVIMAHSWGTLLAYEILHANSDIKVDKFITLGSPLNAQSGDVRDIARSALSDVGIEQIDSLPNVRVWQNYWATCDPISGNISAAHNIPIDPTVTDNFFGTCHSSYYNDYGVWQQILLDVYITQGPLSISYTSNILSAPADITFNAVGYLTSDLSASYAWGFGDGQTASGPSVTHHYGQPGNFNVALTMTDGSGGTHVVTESVTVRQPAIDVTYPNGFEDLYRHFSTPVISGVQSYSWNFGDGVVRTDDDDTTSHTYATSGYYNVTLTQTLSDNTSIQSQVGIFVGPGTRYIQSHTINGYETWFSGGTYVVQGSITVAQGSTLTIEPGVVVKFANQQGITVNGTLDARGTDGNKIVFTSVWDDTYGGNTDPGGDHTTPGDTWQINPGATGDAACPRAANYWGQIIFGATSVNSVIDRADILYGGSVRSGTWCYNPYATGMVFIQSSSVAVTNSTVSSSWGNGIDVSSASPVITGDTISGNGGRGVYLSGNGSSPVITGGTIRDNGADGIYDNASGPSSPVIEGELITENVGWGINCSVSPNPSITGNIVSNNGAGGISCSPSVLSGNTIIGNNGPAIQQDASSAWADGTNTISGNTYNGVAITGGTLSRDTTFTANSALYLINSNVTIAEGVKLTVEPGVVVKFANQQGITVNGTLDARGTDGNKIVFTSVWDDTYGGNTDPGGDHTTPGDTWQINPGATGDAACPRAANYGGQLYFSPTSVNSVIDRADILYGGSVRSGTWCYNPYATGMFSIQSSSVTVSNCTISNCWGDGITVNSSAVIQNNTIANVGGSGITVYGSPSIIGNKLIGSNNGTGINIQGDTSLPVVTGNSISNFSNAMRLNSPNSTKGISGNTASGNTSNAINVQIGYNLNYLSNDATWTADMPYLINGMIYIKDGVTLTIKPGAIIKMGDYWSGYIYVGGRLVANGEPGNKIVFTSAEDDSYGGDTNGDGNATHAGVYQDGGGNWYYHNWSKIVIPSNGMATFDNVIMKHGGLGSNYGPVPVSMLDTSSSSVTLSNSTISNSYGEGISVGSSSPTIQNNIISGNASNGLYYSGASILDATNNNWGDPSGPLDNSDDRVSGGLYNPTGLGNKVSNHVNYFPWTGSIITETATPTGLAGEPNNQVVNLSWTANNEPSLGGYKIYYGTDSGNYVTPIIVGNVTSYKLTTLSNNTTYYIAISSLNSVGAESPKSAEITATPFFDSTKPTSQITSPASGAVLRGEAFVISGTASDTGTGVQKVDVSTDGGANWIQATGTANWSYSWTLPQNGPYTMKSKATDKNNNVEDVGAGISVSVANVMATVTLDKSAYAGPMAKTTITVEDADADATAGPGNDTIGVKVTSDTDAVGELLTLNEDAAVAGIFSGTFGFEPLKTFAGNGKIGISKGDTVKVTYNDECTPSGTPEDVAATATWDAGCAMWLRNADDIINDVGTSRADLYDFCNAPHDNGDARIDTLYLEGYNAINSSPTFLRSFIADAHSHGLRVECLAGAPEWATHAGKDTAEAAFDVITAFNDSGNGDERFDGIHLDVEPYLQADWESQTANVWADYTAMLDACRAKIDFYNGGGLNYLTLAVDIPSWYDTAYPEVTSSDTVQDVADYVVVRAFKDKTDDIAAVTEHEIDYAKSIGKKAVIAVETDCGTFPVDETFCEEGYTVMDLRLDSLAQSYQTNKSFMGVGINTYQGYQSLSQLPNLPVSTIANPAEDATISGPAYTVTGTASSVVGVKKVEVCTDGTNWHDAKDTSVDNSWSTWSYNWTPLPLGDNVIKSRATDSMDNIETPGASANVKVVAYKHLSTSINPSGCGSTAANPMSADGYYVEGSAVELTATPASGYVFTGWSGDATGASNPLSVSMDTDKVIAANFKAKRYLTLSSTVGGSVSANPDHTTGYYVDGDTVTLTATPDKGYKFMSWSGSASGTTNPLTVTMDSNKAISTNFGRQALLLDYIQNGRRITLTATMYYNGSPASGKTITFYEKTGTGSFVSKGTATTNSNGIAVKTFTSTAGLHTAYARFTASGGIPAMQSDNVDYTISKVILASPANGFIVSTPTPTLSWQAYSGVATYHVQVATTTTFGAAALVLDSDTGGTSISAPSLMPGKAYYWRVLAYIPAGKSMYSDVWKFVYKANTTLKLELVSLSGSIVTVKATLTNADNGTPVPGMSLAFYENTNGGTFALKGTAATGLATSANPGVAIKRWTTTVGSHQAYAKFNGNKAYAPCASEPASVTYKK